MSVRKKWVELFEPADRRPIWEWASERFKQLPAIFSKTHAFDVSGSRHFIGPFEALADDHVRQEVIRKPVRGGGSLIGDLYMLWTRDTDPGPMMDVFQNDDVAEDHARNRTVWLMEHSAMATLLPKDRTRRTQSQITFADGLPWYITGPGINNLQTKPVRYLRLDEPWLYKAGTVAMAEARLGDFQKMQTEKLVLISQAGEEGDDFDVKFMEGSQEFWHVPCLGCGVFINPRWTMNRKDGTPAGVVWDKHTDARGFWDVEKCRHSVRFECPECGHRHPDNGRTRAAWNAGGKYVALNPGASQAKRSHHWNAIIDTPWHVLVDQFLTATNAYKQGQPEPLIVFFKQKMAEPKSLRSIGVGSLEFTRRPLVIDPVNEYMRVMTVDRQETHYWALIGSWSKSGEFRRMWFGKLFSRGDLKAKADEFRCHNVIMDAGYEAKGIHGVYATCCIHHTPMVQSWLAVRGVAEKSLRRHASQSQVVESSFSDAFPGDPEAGLEGAGSRAAIVYNASSDRLADALQGLILKGKWIEPAEVDQLTEMEVEYSEQMRAEYKAKAINKKTGKPEWTWIRANPRNHAWDCAKLQVFAAIMQKIIPDLDG